MTDVFLLISLIALLLLPIIFMEIGMDANESCLRELEEENEKLKTQLAQEQTLKEVFFTCYQKKHGDIKGELFELRKQVEGYKRRLNENGRENDI